MWMMEYNDSGDFNMIQDSAFTGRKLRPLIPRPLQSPPTTTTPAGCSRIHASSDFFTQYHHLGEQIGLKEFNSVPQVLVSSRWNPTPEQLRALEELYRRGTRTPSAEQIQQITAQLRRYGKIEGKNVFYWFQNHKARERQKRRRQMESSHDDLQLMSSDHQKKESPGGTSRTMYEAEETKNWVPSTNCMTATSVQDHQQESVKAAGPGSRADGWVQFGEEKLLQRFQQQQRGNSLSTVENNATWQMMMPPPWSCPPPPPSPPSLHNLTHLINTPTCASRATVRTMDIMDPKQLINNSNPNNNKTSLLQPHDLSIFIAPYGSNAAALNHLHRRDGEEEEDGGSQQGDQSQTLQLFPLRSSSCGEKEHLAAEKSALNPNYQFFEFLPLKN